MDVLSMIRCLLVFGELSIVICDEVHDMSGCVNEKGFYNVRYTCKATALTCDFDYNICHIQDNNNGWKIDKAVIVGNDYLDHTTRSGDGLVLFVKTGSIAQTTIQNLIYSNPIQCLSFYYWMNKMSYNDSITIYRVNENGVIDTHFAYNNVRLWKKMIVSFKDKGDYSLRFEARGHKPDSEFIIDDIKIINGDCQELRDRIEYSHTCRKVDEVTVLQGCSKYYIENVTHHLDPMEEKCRTFVNDTIKICNEFSDSIQCDLRQVANINLSRFNLNTLRINYTCNILKGETEQMENDSINIGVSVAAVVGLLLVVTLMFVVIFVIYRNQRLLGDTQSQSVSWNTNALVTSLQAPVNRLGSMDPSSHLTDTNPVTSDSEHRYMAISASYESISEPSNENLNGPGNDNQLPYNYTTLDSSGIENPNPNMYDDLASPRLTNTGDGISTVNHYEEPVPGEYAECIVRESQYEQVN